MVQRLKKIIIPFSISGRLVVGDFLCPGWVAESPECSHPHSWIYSESESAVSEERRDTNSTGDKKSVHYKETESQTKEKELEIHRTEDLAVFSFELREIAENEDVTNRRFV